MTLDEAIERYTNNAEYEQTHGNLQGCLDFGQLARWLRELKALKEQANGDCISRAEAIENIKHAQISFSVKSDIDFTKHTREIQEIVDEILSTHLKVLEKLPSVTPQPKIGHWIKHKRNGRAHVECSECGFNSVIRYNYCPNCTIKMEAKE